nr:SOS response-associated peptidase family protein [Risungbinella massiliensis]
MGKRRRNKATLFHSNEIRGLFSFAGLWDTWDREGVVLHTCTIITTNANNLMEPIHNRMPVIFDPEHEAIWLDTRLEDSVYLKSLLTSYSSDLMEAYPVSKVIGSPRNNSEENINPFHSL